MHIPSQVMRNNIFISYSHTDKKFLDALLIHLKPLERVGIATAWSDKQIAPGSKWMDEIQSALDCAKIAVLLASPAFLASDFVNEHELAPLLKKAENEGMHIIWVPVRASLFKETPLKNYQAVISPDKPLAEMKAERDRAWVTVCEKIREATYISSKFSPRKLPVSDGPQKNVTVPLGREVLIKILEKHHYQINPVATALGCSSRQIRRWMVKHRIHN